MSVGEQAYEQVFDELLLAHDDLVHLHREYVHECAFALDAVIQFLDVD